MSQGPGDAPRGWRWRPGDRLLAGPLMVFVLLRVPSFLEPHWYTDEAGYVTTARSLLQGKVLYTQVWNNKPPIHLWTVALGISVLGDSEAALHVMTFLSGLVTLAAIAYGGKRLLGRRRTLIALLITAALLGSPLFDAELLLPECLLIAPVTWAGVLLLIRVNNADSRRWPLWPAGVGVLAGLAFGYQQTALAETCAFGLILALVAPSGASRARRLAVYAAAVVSLTALWLVPALLTAGASAVAYALVGFYLAFTQSRYAQSEAATALELLLPVAILALIVVSAWLRRREHDLTLGFWVWAAAALLVPTVARQPYAHYLVPSIAPGVMALSSLGLGWRRRRESRRAPAAPRLLGRRAPRLAGVGVVAGAVLALAGGTGAGTDWWPIRAPGNHSMVTYYGGAISVMSRQSSLSAYQDPFDYRVPEDAEVGAWISANGLDGSSAVVWSSDAWLYETNDLQLVLPTAPIYNDNVLLGSDLAPMVAALTPDLIVTEGHARSAWPSINGVLSADYQEMDHSDDGNEIVWVRDDLVASLPRSPAS